jgi:hypothetical protein
MIAKNIK